MKYLFFVMATFAVCSFGANIGKQQKDLNSSVFNLFMQELSQKSLANEAQPVLDLVANAPLANEALFEVALRKDVPLAVRQVAARSIRKTWADTFGFFSNLVMKSGDPIIEEPIQDILIGGIGQYLVYNSMNDPDLNLRISLVMSYMRTLRDQTLLVKYFDMLSNPQIPGADLFAFISSYFSHPDPKVRIAAVKAYRHEFGYSYEPTAYITIKKAFDKEKLPEVRVELIRSMTFRFVKPYRLLSLIAVNDLDLSVRQEAHRTQLELRGWLPVETRDDAYLADSPWSKPYLKQYRKNISARAGTWFLEERIRCGIYLSR